MKSKLTLLLATALLVAGCATAPAPQAEPTPDLGHYHAVVIESVQIAPGAGMLSDANRQVLERRLHDALVESIPAPRRAAAPAADVLRVQVTVTALDAVDPVANGVRATLVGTPIDRGSIAFEARYYAPGAAEPFATVTGQHKAGRFAYFGSLSHYGHAVSALRGWGVDLADSLSRT